MESTIKLMKITFEYSNGNKVEVNAEDLDTISKAIMVTVDKYFEMKKREGQNEKTNA